MKEERKCPNTPPPPHTHPHLLHAQYALALLYSVCRTPRHCTIAHRPPPELTAMDNRKPLLTVMQCRAGQTVLSQDRSRKAKMPIPLNTAKHFIYQFQQFVCVFIYVPSVISKKQQPTVTFFFFFDLTHIETNNVKRSLPFM